MQHRLLARFVIFTLLVLALCLPLLAQDQPVDPPADSGDGSVQTPGENGGVPAQTPGENGGVPAQTPGENGGVPAQPSGETGDGTDEEAGSVDLFLATVALDIATSDHVTLVEWCLSLGLSTTGSDDELRNRLYEYYKTKPEAADTANVSKIITIERAEKTEYFTLDEPYPHVIVKFTGNVLLSIKDMKTGETHVIRADELIYNKTAQLLSAKGNIRYEKKNGSTTEIFLGSSIDINLDTWEGSFRQGENRREGGETQTKLIFQAEDVVKKSDNVLIFKNAVISSCDSEEKHYSLRAGRLWLLGSNEWAVSNAMLYVGELPVLYLPFFYYPGEEIVFHPVFGYRDREGRFVQTTTYILGERAPKEQSISLFKLTEGGAGYERKVEGVFLRTQRTKKEKSEENVLKILFDYYVNLGGVAAVDAVFPLLGPVKNFKAYLGIGVTRTIFPLSSKTYSPFVLQNDYASSWDSAYYLGLDLPLRFSFSASGSISTASISGSYSFEGASDPYFGRDFAERSEYMDWLQFMKEADTDTEGAAQKKTTLQDTLALNGTIPLPFLEPYVKTFSINSLSLSLTWLLKTKTAPTDPDLAYVFQYSPTSEFFVPDTFKIVEGGLTIGGTLLQLPSKAAAKKNLEGIPLLVSPWAEQKAPVTTTPSAGTGSADSTDSAETTGASNPSEAADAQVASTPSSAELSTESSSLFILPDLYKPDIKTVQNQVFGVTLTYQLSPTINWSERFNYAAWKNPEEVDLAILYEVVSYGISGNVQPKFQFLNNMISLDSTLTGTTRNQTRLSYLDDPLYVTPTMLSAWLRQDAQYRTDSLGAKFGVTVSPFGSGDLFAPTQAGWNYDILLYEYKFKTMQDTTPIYDTYNFDWTKNGVKTNSLNAVLGIKLDTYTESIRLSGNLPPLLPSYGLNLNLAWLFGTFTATTKYYQKTETDPFVWDPASFTLNLRYEKFPSLSLQGNYDFDAAEVKTLTGNFTWDTFNLQVVAKKSPAATFVFGSGWLDGTEVFQVNSASASYKLNWKPEAIWKNRITLETQLALDFSQNFIRFNEAGLGVTGTLAFKIFEFMDIAFSFTSRNQNVWRYYSNLFPLPEELSELADPVNPFIDILNGFRFDSQELRQSSLFKLKSLNLKLTHYMHDWNLTFEYSTAPVYNALLLQYEFKNTLSLFLGWTGVPEIKTQYKKDGDTVTW